MKLYLRLLSALSAAAALLVPLSVNAQEGGSPRLELNADSAWKFALGDPNGAEAPAFADQSWRTVQLPHDWSIESAPDPKNPSGSGGGFFPNGTGWYRKTFSAPSDWKGKCVSIEFDGIYRNATVYLNGRKIGTQPYGYTSFELDLTSGLSFTSRNVLAVRVDNSAQPNSRWYSGSGIYRHVRVIVKDKTHVAHWGIFVSTPAVSDTTANVQVRTRVADQLGLDAGLTVQTTLLDRSGSSVGAAQSPVQLVSGSEKELIQDIAVNNPQRWSPESPVLYRVLTRLVRNGQVVDQVVTPFGIRSLEWSAENGLLLNGKPVKLRGGSVHHDNGPLGARGVRSGRRTQSRAPQSGRL